MNIFHHSLLNPYSHTSQVQYRLVKQLAVSSTQEPMPCTLDSKSNHDPLERVTAVAPNHLSPKSQIGRQHTCSVVEGHPVLGNSFHAFVLIYLAVMTPNHSHNCLIVCLFVCLDFESVLKIEPHHKLATAELEKLDKVKLF